MKRIPIKWLASSDRRPDAVALGSILVFFVLFFPQGLFGGRYLLANDAFFYSFPLRTIAWRMIRAGNLPLWTPNILSGYPLLSMAQIGLAYPLTWGYLLLPGRIAEQIYVLAPFLLAPLFTFAYLREIGRSALASLMGALTFGYGGMMASPLANNGFMPNAVMWLPLLLIAVERSRTKDFVSSLLLGTFAFSMSVLTGYGQGFVLVGLLTGAYALMLAVSNSKEPVTQPRLLSAWRPVLVALCAGVISAGVAAFQILETARALRRSVRSELSYAAFTQGSISPAQLWQSIFKPLFYIDTYAYVPPLALLLTVWVISAFIKKRIDRDPRVLFWLCIAFISLFLMLGDFTPLYRLVYHVPVLNRFRVPSRHAFEWTFALGALAAYGWDAAYATIRKSTGQQKPSNPITLYASLICLFVALIVAVVWWQESSALRAVSVIPARVDAAYTICKTLFVLLTLAAAWRAALIPNPNVRLLTLTACVLLMNYVEPAALIDRWWGSINLKAERFNARSDATRYLNQFSPSENRVYTRVDLFSEQFASQPRLDGPNLSAIYELQNVAGYEPLILERYSRALGGTDLDAVHRLTNYSPDPTLLTAQSHVLDLLNTRYVIAYSNLATALEPFSVDNRTASIQSLGELPPHSANTFGAPPAKADALLLVTALANSVEVPQGSNVARIRVTFADGRKVEHDLQAGIDTAEWAHERPDVRAVIKHQLAPIFDTAASNEAQGFPSYRFKTQFSFGDPVQVSKVEIENVSATATLALFGAALVDSARQRATPLIPLYDKTIWQPVYDAHETLILRNSRALPRVWLVGHAEAVTDEVALRRIRGEGSEPFDPQQTALLEVRPEELPKLPGNKPGPESSVKIVEYGANKIIFESTSATESLLVASEIFYPGWVARVDGQPASIFVADYLLRAVALPPGQHRIVMNYTAPAAQSGLIISVLTIALVGVFIFYARRKQAS